MGLDLAPGLNQSLNPQAEAERTRLERSAHNRMNPPKNPAPLPFGMIIDATPFMQYASTARKGKWWISSPERMLLEPNKTSTYTWQPFDGKRATRTRALIRQGKYRPVLVGELDPNTAAEIETAEGPDMPVVTGDVTKDAERKKLMRVRDGDCELYEVSAEAARDLYQAPIALSIMRTANVMDNGVTDDGSGGIGGDLRTAVERTSRGGVHLDVKQHRA